jgi:hypothetical protein
MEWRNMGHDAGQFAAISVKHDEIEDNQEVHRLINQIAATWHKINAQRLGTIYGEEDDQMNHYIPRPQIPKFIVVPKNIYEIIFKNLEYFHPNIIIEENNKILNLCGNLSGRFDVFVDTTQENGNEIYLKDKNWNLIGVIKLKKYPELIGVKFQKLEKEIKRIGNDGRQFGEDLSEL